MKRDRKTENIDRLHRYLNKRGIVNNETKFNNIKNIKSVLNSGVRIINGIVVNNMYQMLNDTEISEEQFDTYRRELTNEARSKGKMGVKQSAQHRLNNSLSKKGIKKSNEFRVVIAEKMKGNNNYKKNFDEDRRQQQSETMKSWWKSKKQEMVTNVKKPKFLINR